MKIGPGALFTSEICPEAQNVKTGSDTLGTTHNVFGSAKHEN
jgi:hypothetical protein